MDTKKEKHKIQKKRYNSKLSTFQIDKELHMKVKKYCEKNSLIIKNFLETTIKNTISQ